MIKRILLLALIGAMLNVSTMAKAKNEAEFEAKVKAGIAKLGVSEDSFVKIKLRDNRKVKGFISEITDEGFSVTNKKTKAVTKINYSSVKQIKGKNNLSGNTITLIGIFAAMFLIVVFGGL